MSECRTCGSTENLVEFISFFECQKDATDRFEKLLLSQDSRVRTGGLYPSCSWGCSLCNKVGFAMEFIAGDGLGVDDFVFELCVAEFLRLGPNALSQVKREFPEIALKLSLDQSSGKNFLFCCVCAEPFVVESALRAHILTHLVVETPTPKSYRCPLCDKETGNATNLERHVKKHKKKESALTKEQSSQ